MNDNFYMELRSAYTEINKILCGEYYDEAIRTIEMVSDIVDMVQTISIVMEQTTFLDAYMKIGDYSEMPFIDEISDIFEIYVSHVEMGKMKYDEVISDEALMDLFMMKCMALDNEPIMKLAVLISSVACISMKNKDSLETRQKKIMAMLPEIIVVEYEKSNRFDELKKASQKGVILNFETLSRGDILFPRKLVGYSYVRFIDETLCEMNKTEIEMLTALLYEDDLINVMSVLSGKARKKIMNSLEYEELFRISKKVFLFTYSLEGEKEGIFQDAEIYNSIHEELTPSFIKAIEKILVIVGSKFKYMRV